MRPRSILPGLPASSAGAAIGAAVLVAVLLSRLLLLPEGPWEQDEALFAAGVLDFDVTRHRPHPPGFPGWIGLGAAVNAFADDPVRALQLLSSVASVGLFWALAHGLHRIVPGGRATALALAFTASPLAWVHAGRAFSTTPAVACGALAVVLWSGGGRAHRGGWGLLALAATIRPQLVPELAVLGLAGLAAARTRRLAMEGIALAAVIALAGVVAVLLAGPSPSAVLTAFADHAARHGNGLHRSDMLADLGIVRGLGHPALALALGLATLTGLGLALRKDRRQGMWLLGLLVVTAWMILRQHHPGFPRYAVALLAAALPALAWSLAAVPLRVGHVLAWGLAILGGVAALGPVLSMHRAPLPVVAAVRRATVDPNAHALAYSHGLFSFARLQAERANIPAYDVLDAAAPPALPQRTYAISGRTLHFLDGVTACTVVHPQADARSMSLGQGRFGTARLGRDVVLLGEHVYTPEHDEVGDRFAWVSPGATLHLPAGAERLHLRLDAPLDVVGSSIELSPSGAEPRSRPIPGGPFAMTIDVAPCPRGCTVRIDTDAAHDAPGDPRTLAVRLEGAWVQGPGYMPSFGVWSPGLPRSARAHDVTLEGFEAPETFGQGRRGAWTSARARITLPASPGRVRLRVARPAHSAGTVVLRTDAETTELDLGPAVTTVFLRTGAPQGRATVSLQSPTFVPADVRAGSGDDRALGLIVYEVAVLPVDDPCADDDVSLAPRGSD